MMTPQIAFDTEPGDYRLVRLAAGLVLALIPR